MSRRSVQLAFIGGFCLLLGWLSAIPAASAAPGEYSAELIGQADAVSLKSGESAELWVDIKNTGTATWVNSGATAVKIGTVRSRDRASALQSGTWLSPNRVTSASQVQVAPGATVRFTFSVTAALGPGQHREYFGLVAEGITWFDDFEFAVDVNVLPTTFRGSVISTFPAIKLKTGETHQISLQVRNDGNTIWRSSGPTAVKVGTATPLDRSSPFYVDSWLSPNRVTAPVGDVGPGAIGSFNITLAAPSRTGQFQESFALVAERLTWIEGTTFTLNITVEPAIYSASFVSQSEDLVLSPGEEQVVWVELKNEGNTIWHAAGERPTKLGTASPLDRESGFRHSSWESGNRAAVVQTDTPPGSVGRFSFTIKAPDKIGNYQEPFRPLVEHVTWMEDVGISWSVVVSEELVLVNPIRVGLSAATAPITVNSTNGMVVRQGDGKALVVRATGGNPAVVTPFNGGYSINVAGGNHEVRDYLRFIPVNGSILSISNDQVSSRYNQFRGIVTIRRSAWSGRVWMVNELELEDYLKGIAEVPESWPIEARKAQVVAARTFALRRIDGPRADIFDLYNDTRDQVYYGYNYEINRPGIAQAVEETKGMAVLYGGQPALTYYHSDSGGATDNVEDIWNKGNPSLAIPYLKGVPDPYAKPVTWSATLSQNYIQDRFDNQLRKVNAVFETVVDIVVEERFPSGRMKRIALVTSTGKRAIMDIATFDYLTDSNYVRSMNFTVSKVGAPSHPDFLLEGKGNGHGIGLSQWSAYNMANQGQTFDQILKFFYSGVNIGMA